MTVERSETCATCDHREVEHESTGRLRGCLKWGCRCFKFVSTGRARIVLPIRPAGGK